MPTVHLKDLSVGEHFRTAAGVFTRVLLPDETPVPPNFLPIGDAGGVIFWMSQDEQVDRLGKRDDRLGLPGDDLRFDYRVALLVPCPAPQCLAPVGYLCTEIHDFFHGSRYDNAVNKVLHG